MIHQRFVNSKCGSRMVVLQQRWRQHSAALVAIRSLKKLLLYTVALDAFPAEDFAVYNQWHAKKK